MKRRMMFLASACCLSMAGLAQSSVVSGKVVDVVTGEPIVGATVTVEGTQLGVSTGVDGSFTLRGVPEKSKSVMISYVGMKTVNAPISSNMSVAMESNTELLDEVFVVAYGVAKKSSYTGSAQAINSKEIKDLPNLSFEGALSGKIAGLQVNTSSGQAGSVPSIRIRGIGSMNASNEPLYVIDGVATVSGDVGQMSDYTMSTNNAMSTLNPEDIESISVLKDAAASSLYGSRAANGVVLITTKKGKAGKPVVDLKMSVGFTPCWATKNYEAASVQEQVNMLYTIFHDYRSSNGKTDEVANAYALSTLNKKFNKHGYQFSTSGVGKYENVDITGYGGSGRENTYFDWNDAYFRTAMYQSYDLAVSGATGQTNYYTSVSYTKDQGRLKVNNFDRLSGRVNLTQKIGSFMEFATNMNVARTQKEGYNDTRSTGVNLFMQSRNLLWGLYWPTNYATGEDWTNRYGSYAYNGLYYDKEWENKSVDTRLQAMGALTLHLLPSLDVKSVFSYDYSLLKDHLYYSANHFSGSATNGKVHEMRTTYSTLVSSTTANYSVAFGESHVAALVGFEAEKSVTDFVRATGEGLPISTLHTVATAGTVTSTAYDWGHAMVSVLSKFDYNYANKYFGAVSYRRDGSSKLSPENRWGDFWSVSGAWNMRNEAFLSSSKVLSDLKLRLSYGVNGTLPTSNYGYLNLMTYQKKYLGNPGGTISSMANRNLGWESSHTTNVGLDFGFMNQRLRGTVEYFNRDSKDLLQDVPICTVTGFSSVLKNVGQINNKGVELSLAGDIIKTKDVEWNASVNATFLKSKVVKLNDGADIIWYDPTGDDERAQYLYREGESTLAFYGYEWAGVDPENGKSVYYVNDKADSQKGDFTFNGRGATYDFNKANYTIIGNAIPAVSGGFNTNVKWRGVDLGLAFIYKIGGNIYDGAYKDVADDGYYWERIRAKSYYENMWTPTHTNGTEPALSGNDLEDALQYSSRHISSASFLRLKNLSLAYTLPRNLVKKAFLAHARIYMNITNLLTFAKYKEADPEVNQYGTRGWETPLGKTFVFGIDLKF